MKLAIAAVFGLTTLFSAGVFYNKTSAKQPTPSTVQTSEVVQIPTVQISAPTQSTNNALIQNKTVLKQKVDKKRVLYLNETVTQQSITGLVNKLKQLNSQSSEPVYLLINSPGGSVLDGATLISEMEASKAPVYTVCTSLCASMGAMIHSYGSKRYGLDRSILMYHPASGGTQGQIPNMLSQLNTITRYIDKMVANVVSRSKVSQAEFDKLVAYEIWIDAEDAVARGLNDGIISLNVPNEEEGSAAFLPSPRDRKRNRPSRSVTDIQWIAPNPELWERE